MKNLFRIMSIFVVFILIGLIIAGCSNNTEQQGFTISWEVDGVIVETLEKVEEGMLPSYTGPIPEKIDFEYEYEFSGWSPEVTKVIQNQKYVAIFTRGKKIEYKVTWLDVNDNIIEISNYFYGDMPSHDLPSNTVEWEYTGWSPKIEMVTEDATYKVNREIKHYEIRWLDSDDKQLGVTSVPYGTMPNYNLPSDTNQWEYLSWSPELTEVTEDKVYKAERKVKEYEITWLDSNDELLGITTVNYGEIPTFNLPENTVEWEYVDWSPNITAVYKDVTYKAGRVAKKYSITWLDADDSLIGITSVPYGEIPSYNLPNDTIEWKYLNWSPTLVEVTGDTSYRATREIQRYTINFETNGGTSINSITADYNTLISKPADPVREGYRFVAWSIDQELQTQVSWPIELIGDMTVYAFWNQQIPYKEYLQALLGSYGLSPYSFIPETMQPGYNLINHANVVDDYSAFVSINDILGGGFGEQWQMVVNNLNQSTTFFNVLTVVDTLSATSIAAFNNYIDSNPADSSHYDFTTGTYNVTIQYKDGKMFYVLDYTATLPVLGEQTVQIMLSYDILTLEKEGRIQLGEANVLKYISSNNRYEFAIKYLGIRRAYFEIVKLEDDSIEGRIFEYLGLDNVYTKGSSAQFFINDEYTSVVGNKASGMLGWEGTINELYKTNEGKLIGYEVREKFPLVTYNTLWFNLSDTTGITSIRSEDASFENQNPNVIYVNNSSDEFIAKKVGGIGLKMTSRRYDIELRKQYFYYFEGDELVEIEVITPMIFVQQEQLNTLQSDIISSNPGVVTSFNFNVSTTHKEKIIYDYNNLIDLFILQKEDYSPENIIDFIGSEYNH